MSILYALCFFMPQKAINCKVTYKGKTHQAVTAKKFITPDKSSIKDEIKAKP